MLHALLLQQNLILKAFQACRRCNLAKGKVIHELVLALNKFEERLLFQIVLRFKPSRAFLLDKECFRG